MSNSQNNDAEVKQLIARVVNPLGEFNGSTLVLDPATGFLTAPEKVQVREVTPGKPGNVFGPLAIFTAEKKVLFLSALMDLFPNYSECSKSVGISRWTFKNHYQVDEKFKACVDEISQIWVDQIEKKRFELAIQDKGALDRMAVLNAYRREIYNPAIQVEVNHSPSVEEGRNRAAKFDNVIDATIVERVKDVQRETRKLA